jgi:hypothetical protein
LFLDGLIYALFPFANWWFLGSAILQSLISKIAVGVYAYHLVLIDQVDLSAPVLESQEKIARLQASTLWVARLLFLQMPLWTTFYWNESMLSNGHPVLWAMQIIGTLGLAFISVWLFFNIKDKNRNQRWFKWIFDNAEWTPTLQAMEALERVKEYRQERFDNF